MDWLNVAWLAMYWIPLTIALVFGILLGWLLTRPSINRKRAEYESHVDHLQAQIRQRDQELAAANAVRRELETVQAKNHELANTVEERNQEIADLNEQVAQLQNVATQLAENQRALESATAENARVKAELEAAQAAAKQLKADLYSANADLETARTMAAERAELSQRTQHALAEADQQLSALRNQLDETVRVLTTAQTSVDSLHTALVQ